MKHPCTGLDSLLSSGWRSFPDNGPLVVDVCFEPTILTWLETEAQSRDESRAGQESPQLFLERVKHRTVDNLGWCVESPMWNCRVNRNRRRKESSRIALERSFNSASLLRCPHIVLESNSEQLFCQQRRAAVVVEPSLPWRRGLLWEPGRLVSCVGETSTIHVAFGANPKYVGLPSWSSDGDRGPRLALFKRTHIHPMPTARTKKHGVNQSTACVEMVWCDHPAYASSYSSPLLNRRPRCIELQLIYL